MSTYREQMELFEASEPRGCWNCVNHDGDKKHG